MRPGQITVAVTAYNVVTSTDTGTVIRCVDVNMWYDRVLKTATVA